MSFKTCIQRSIGLLQTHRCISNNIDGNLPIPPKKVISEIEEKIMPAYFKPLRPLKLDAEQHRMPRFDALLYRPSKSLDRTYQTNWVDCVLEKKVRRSRQCERVPAEVQRRQTPLPRWAIRTLQKCRKLMPIFCRPLIPSPCTEEKRCIKFPSCKTRKPLCRIRNKKPSDRPRRKTRYPSYSECKSEPTNPFAINECNKPFSTCELWRVFRNRYRN